eukprot:2393272-Pleurochrysis_carterae.AAC.1
MRAGHPVNAAVAGELLQQRHPEGNCQRDEHVRSEHDVECPHNARVPLGRITLCSDVRSRLGRQLVGRDAAGRVDNQIAFCAFAAANRRRLRVPY